MVDVETPSPLPPTAFSVATAVEPPTEVGWGDAAAGTADVDVAGSSVTTFGEVGSSSDVGAGAVGDPGTFCEAGGVMPEEKPSPPTSPCCSEARPVVPPPEAAGKDGAAGVAGGVSPAGDARGRGDPPTPSPDKASSEWGAAGDVDPPTPANTDVMVPIAGECSTMVSPVGSSDKGNTKSEEALVLLEITKA